MIPSPFQTHASSNNGTHREIDGHYTNFGYIIYPQCRHLRKLLIMACELLNKTTNTPFLEKIPTFLILLKLPAITRFYFASIAHVAYANSIMKACSEFDLPPLEMMFEMTFEHVTKSNHGLLNFG